MIWVEKKEGGGGKRDFVIFILILKKKNEIFIFVYIVQIKIYVFGIYKLKEIKKERGGGIMGRCFYYYFVGKIVGNVKKRIGLVISYFFVFIYGI